MSILDRAAGGSVLELPVEQVTDRASGDQSEADALRQRVIDGLLWYQRPIVEDAEHRMVAFVAGYGAGKTRTLAAWATVMSLDNPGCVGVLFAPTGPLVRDVLIRTLEDYWTEIGVEFEYRVTPLPEFRLYLPMGTVTILCRSMENWSRIIGINAAWIGADEIDTSKTEIARRAVEKFLGRLRAGTRRQLGMFSTPEGFGILYNLFVEEGHRTDRALYRAKSTDNPHLPADFIEGMRENYPPAMLRSYLDGEFTNLTQASVYPEFDRALNVRDVEPANQSDTLYLGVDFNVGRCIIAVCAQRADGVHVIAEHVARDTPGVIDVVLEHYAPWVDHNQLVVCPDASSQSRSTKNAGISDFGLMKQAGLRMQTQASNPFIRDRVLTVNSLILNAKGERRLFVHPDCKLIIKGLEQQPYDQATQQPEKGDGGQDDLSGQTDALGYACWQLAGITAWNGGRGHNSKTGSLIKRKPKLY